MLVDELCVIIHEEILDALGKDEREKAIRILESNWRVSLDYLLPWLRKARS